MPNKLVNNTLSSLANGVTQQYQEGRFDSQVSIMNNCMPSITRGLMRRNPIESVNILESIPTDLASSFVYTYDRGTGDEQYMLIVPGDGSILVYSTVTGKLLYESEGQEYLFVDIGTRAKDTFKMMTIGDHTFIVNTQKVVLFDYLQEAPTRGYSDMALYWIKKTAGVIEKQYQSSTDVGSLMKGYEYTLNNLLIQAYSDTRPGTDIDMNTSSVLAAEFATHTVESGVDKNKDAICFNTAFAGADWYWSDSFGDEASLGVWETIRDGDELPVNMSDELDGFIVRVTGNTAAEHDDYYLQYDYGNKTWAEIPSPGSLTTLDATTMPHVLYRLADGSFHFDTYQKLDKTGLNLTGETAWGEREAGGDDPLEDPSFVGAKLNNLFFHKNRLGFITSDNVILSRTNDYGNFFFQTIQDVMDDDPIDLAVASTDVTILRHAVPTAGQLILFADDTQFSLQSGANPLTPLTADIAPLSSYTYGGKADAVSIGNRVLFSNQVGSYSQIYSYQITDAGSQLTEANPMTLHIPSYIDKSLARIIGHDVLGYTFMEIEDEPKKLIVLTSVHRGQEELQNAFHTWHFRYNIASTHIINNNLYILFTNGDLTKMTLEVPGKLLTTYYVDQYALGDEHYNSEILFSEFFLRDKTGKGSVRGRYQLRTIQYTVTDSSQYMTSIRNTEYNTINESTQMGPLWLDSQRWLDSKTWTDETQVLTRDFYNDEKVTVSANSKKVEIYFRSNPDVPHAGFELATANIEALFNQRSSRT